VVLFGKDKSQIMIGLGTIINVAAVILGSAIGLIIKNGLKERFQDILKQGCGVAAIFIGITGALSGLLYISDTGQIGTRNILLLVISIVVGSFFGELLNIEHHMEHIGERFKKLVYTKRDPEKDNTFVEGFMTSTLVICVGAMAIVGSLQDGLTGDFTTLATKSVLDFVITIIFASTLGIGVMFSAIPLAIYQGTITLFAFLIADHMSDAMITNMSAIGSALIFCVGINLVFGKIIRVGNMLPAILIPIIYSLVFF
jgi:uncharacterized membrane protein YqgA involved in biofilm formation